MTLIVIRAPWNPASESLIRTMDALGYPPDRVLTAGQDPIPWPKAMLVRLNPQGKPVEIITGPHMPSVQLLLRTLHR
jgi:hypothetical protein